MVKKTSPPSVAAKPRWVRRAYPLLAFALIAGIAVLAYLPALRGSFVWDDDAHLTAPVLRSGAGLVRIWTDVGATQQYYPLLHTAFWVQDRFWGHNPLGYHVVTLALHLGVAGLFALTLRRLAVPGALLAAAIFALHPVHVESVAWISEQKNTLSTALYLGALLLYLRFDSSRRPLWYGLATLVFVLALLAKTMTATLPAALLVIFWWQRGHLNLKRDVAPLMPWFVIGASGGLFTAWVERTLIGADGAAFDLALPERVLLAGKVIVFYLGKLVWPSNLTFIYPRWDIDGAALAQWLPLAVVLALVVILYRIRHCTRAPLAAFLLFTGSLFPVLGFLNVYPFQYSYVADHFQYLPSLGLIALAAAGVARLAPSAPLAVGSTAAGLLLVLAALTWRQSADYRDAETLYRATLARNPACWMAHNNLGKELFATPARLPEAIDHFEQALALRPDYAEAHNNLGLALTQTGRPREAIPHLETSVRLKPDSYQTHNNFGIALASSGRADDALVAFARAAELNPRLPNIRENWAKALLLLGRDPEAAEHFAAAARLRADTHANR